jgi:hypothetical protein
MNNATIIAADRTTHLKIVAISLVASIAVIMIAMMSHRGSTEGLRLAREAPGPAIKVGTPYASRGDAVAIR